MLQMYQSSPVLPGIDSILEEVETARRATMSPLLVQVLGLVPGLSDQQLSALQKVLEIDCGTSAWVREFALTYPTVHVIGLDVRSAPLGSRLSQPRSSSTSQFSIASSSIDLVTLQFLSEWMTREEVPMLLQECRRVLHKGGILRFTESVCGDSNAPAHAEWQGYWQALKPGWFWEIEALLNKEGFQAEQRLEMTINYSYGTPLHEPWKRDLLIRAALLLPRLIEREVLSREQGENLRARLCQELSFPTFRGCQPFVTILARKRGNSAPPSRRLPVGLPPTFRLGR